MIPKVQFEVEAGMYCDFLNYLIKSGLYISCVKSTDFGFSAVCCASNYRHISKIARKFQCRTRVLKRKGIYFKTYKLLKRKGLLVGAVLILCCSFLFSNLIWRIDVITPSKSITEDVYSILYNNDCYVGAVFYQPKNQNIIQKIFMNVDNVGYVTMNFYKGILTCKIDSTINKMPYLENRTDGNITASMDGIIEEIEIYNGFSDIKPGQSVAKGDVLVNASYVDRNGTLQQVMPRAYVKAYCVKEYSAQVLFDKTVLLRTGRYTDNISYKFAGIDFEIKKSDNEVYEYYDKETIFEYTDIFGFRLPVTKETVRLYEKEKVRITHNNETAENVAKRILNEILKNDTSLISQDKSEYHTSVSEEGVLVRCKVYGHYNIA